MKKLVYFFAFLLTCILAPGAAYAASCPVVHTFVTGETLTGNNLNANPTQFSNCFNSIDNSNIGNAGLYASNLTPSNAAQATFGGTQDYTFPQNLTVNGNIANTGALTTTGNIVTGGSVGAATSVQGKYLNTNYSLNQGLIYAGGNNVAQLDYNITNANQWTVNTPLHIIGNVISDYMGAPYPVPYDVSGNAPTAVSHLDRVGVSVSMSAGQSSACTGMVSFHVPYTVTPTMFGNQVGQANGYASFVTFPSVTATAFLACVNTPAPISTTTTFGFSALAIGT